jgi:hypothetical protein
MRLRASRQTDFNFESSLSMNTISIWRLLPLVVGLVFILNHPAVAQPARTSQDSIDDDLFVHFYNDPRPERLLGFLDRYGKRAPSWNAFPPAVGFFAVVFRRHPDWIDRLVPAHFDARTAEAIVAALRLSGQSAVGQSLKSRIAEAGSDATLKAELAGPPVNLEDIGVATPTHLDILWGASFASGDDRYVRLIADFLAKTANRSELVAIDVAKTTLAISGGPGDILGQLKDKYGEALTREIVVAATAAWALESNAQQHAFVEKALTQYIAMHSGSPAAKVLSALHRSKR